MTGFSTTTPDPDHRDELRTLQHELAELVRLSLVELADMSELQERLQEISARISSQTPQPEMAGTVSTSAQGTHTET